MFPVVTHRWAGGDTKASEKVEEDVKGFSLRLKKNLSFLTFSVPSKNPRCSDKWHKNVTLIQVLLLEPAVLLPPPTCAPGKVFLQP